MVLGPPVLGLPPAQVPLDLLVVGEPRVGGGAGDTDAPSQVDVEPIGTYPGNESSFREIVRLK